MKKDEIINEFGDDYEETSYYFEPDLDHYFYKDLGLSFLFRRNSKYI